MTTYTWQDNATGDFSDASKWGGTVPLAADTAVIRSGYVKVTTGLVTTGSLELTGGVLEVSGGTLGLTQGNGGNLYIPHVNISGFGLFVVNGGAVNVGADLNTASGRVIVQGGGELQWNGQRGNNVDGSVGSVANFVVDLQAGRLSLPGGFDGQIKNFDTGDSIQVVGDITSQSYDNNVLSVSTSRGYHYNLNFIGSYYSFNFVHSGGTITYTTLPAPPDKPTINGLSSATDTGTSQSDGVTRGFQGDGFIQVTGKGFAGDTISIYVDGNQVTDNLQGSNTVDSNGNWQQGFFISGEGAHTITATQSDGYATSDYSSGYKVTLDTTAPTISSVTLDKTVYKLGDTVTATIQLSGRPDGNGNYVLGAGSTIDGATLTSGTYVVVNNFLTASFVVGPQTADVINGNPTVNLTVVDAAGNTSAPSTTAIAATTTINSHAPSAVGVAGFTNGTTDTGTSAIAAGSTIGALSTTDASPGDSFTYSLTGTDAGSFQIVNGVLQVGNTSLITNRTYSFKIVSQDLGGNSYAQAVQVTGLPTTQSGLIAYTSGTSYTPAAGLDAPVTIYAGPVTSYTVTPNGAGLTVSNGTQTQDIVPGSGPAAYNLDFSTNTAAVSLTGGDYNDVLRGGAGNDTLNGGAGNDLLEGGAGADTFDGGTGINTVSYEHSTAGVTVDLRGGNPGRNDSLGDTFQNIQNIRGGSGDDTLVAGSGRHIIEGGAGADTITGRDGGDIVASYIHSIVGVTVDLGLNDGTQAQVSDGDASGDILSGVNNIYGSTHDDTLTGNARANTIRSFGGTDTISSGAGNDRVFISGTPAMVDGGADFDVLDIEAGGSTTLSDNNFQNFERVIVENGASLDMSGVSQSLFIRSASTAGNAATIGGTGGNDRIYGGAGNDVLRGGAGSDTIRAGEADQTIEGGAGNDLIFASTGTGTNNPQDTFNMMMSGFGRDTIRGTADALSNDIFQVAGIGAQLSDLTFAKHGNGAIVTGAAGQPGDGVFFAGLTVDQAKGLNFRFDAPVTS